jgi:hypothetical protein
MPKPKPEPTGRERRRISREWFTACLASAFFVLSFIGVLRHEPWRDEYQAWMVAKDAASIPQLFENVKYEGNPALWHLILFAVTRVSDDPFAMSLVHILISTTMIAVFARYAALPPLPKVLFAFGYAAFYEFNLISRGYASGLLFLMLFCALYRQRDRYLIVAAVLLALMANNSPFGLMLSLVMGAHLLAEHVIRRRAATAWGPLVAASAFLVVGWALSVLQIYPEPDNTFPVLYAKNGGGVEGDRLAFAVTRILASYLPIPDFSEHHYWNRTIFYQWRAAPQIVLSVGLFLAFAVGFLRKRLVALLYIGGTILLVAFVYQTRMAFQRYCLHLTVLLVICFAVERHYEEDLRSPWLRRLSARVRPWSGRLLIVVLAGSAYAGIAAYVVDLMRPFTASHEAAAFLRERGLADLEIIGHSDFVVSPLAAILDKKIYYPSRSEYGRFVIWNRGRKADVTFDDISAAIGFMLQKGETRFLWIADSQPRFEEDGRTLWFEGGDDLVPGANITLLGKIPPAVVLDEHYVIYVVESTPGKQ